MGYNNLLLTEREGRTGEYWPEVVAVRTERSEVRAETTEGQHSPVRLELGRLVSSLLYGIRAMLVLNLPAFETKNTQLMTVSTETVRMAKSRPRKNQSERSDLLCHIIMMDSFDVVLGYWYNCRIYHPESFKTQQRNSAISSRTVSNTVR